MTSPRADERVKVVVNLEKDEDDYPPADYEGLWALPVGEGLFRIDNVPFFARGIAYGDIVSATLEQQELRFREVVRPSGHSTLRLIIYDEKDIPSVRQFLEELGCDIERSHIPGLISVDVPPTVPLAVLKRHLDEGEAQERWGYEEACLAQ
ncbi:DUF4265 domain-containing protein [Cystobacter ferrugineus]|uniref:DUF4265 domain-containing protein n=1 Tax=Cystobacter ferrugineus TaxID=83449 RepID=A0A1L9AYR5_9BACT|nr:DUF4265 domain-containing protein [Cystobacter ferrugineus]OJH35150.1 hypothetical protein BON30_39500 [Cystobacter ferrugineus]